MDKNILDQYMDACALIKETEADIQELKKRKRVVQDSVKGSNPEFPYQSQSFHIEGTTERTGDWSLLAAEQRILADRKANAAKIKTEVEAWMNTIPQRMQRIIRMKIFKNLEWERIADEIGRGATGDSVRKEFERFIKK
jgi:hypothetical protein